MTFRPDIEKLFRTHYRPMLTLANRLLHDEELSRDIVHDVFAALLSSHVAEISPAYLMQGVRFACLKHLRSLSVRERVAQFLALDFREIDDDEWPDEDAIVLLQAAVAKLPERTRRVVSLRFAGRLTYREIAEELSISEVAVYKHLKDAINVLRQNVNLYDR